MDRAYDIGNRNHKSRQLERLRPQGSRFQLNDAQFTLVLVTTILMVYVGGRLLGWWW